MQILAVDIGTGTQDILLFDSARSPENCLKLVMPSPTVIVAQRIREATRNGMPLVLTGSIMGGGPSSWAVEGHRKAGLPVYAAAGPARTLNDDLDQVRADLGLEIVGDEEADRLAVAGSGYAAVRFGDFDYAPIRAAFAAFGHDLRPDALALAVFDHGAAPPGVSDRQFRMDYLVDRLRSAGDARLTALAHRAEDVPPIMTRLAALARAGSEQAAVRVAVMDTAPAAVLGALDDERVAEQDDPLVANVGNFHTLAFQFRGGQPVRLFEHHTGLLDAGSLSAWLRALADGSITHDAVFAEHGHGALALDAEPVPLGCISVTGPRQALLRSAALPLYTAVPHGDQMLAGCFGLLRACAELYPEWREEIESALSGGDDRSLW